MEKKFEIINWEDQKSILLKEENNGYKLFVKNDFINEKNRTKYKNIKFNIAYLDQQEGTLVSADKNILDILGYVVNEGKNLNESLYNLREYFLIKNLDYLKFRGDLAEAIFLYKIGGEKLKNGLSADILFNGDLIEIKSFSPQKKTIVISNQQLLESTIKYAVPILLDNEGKTIIEIANNLSNDFKKYLIKKYNESEYSNLKYKVSKPIDVTSQIPRINLEFDNLISADFIFKINY